MAPALEVDPAWMVRTTDSGREHAPDCYYCFECGRHGEHA